ncbi:uncharacterized protein LOC142588725 [Dermacentor variabilis]|uniref:uncharacterized protein LOC142588725 n=1 Tax=Dermacentor variabilis TaxID=34621 RepID=UPI003F5C0973
MPPAKARSQISNAKTKKPASGPGASSKAAPSTASKSPDEEPDASQPPAHEGGRKASKAAVARKKSEAAKQPSKDKLQVQKKPDKEALSHRASTAAPAQRRASHAATTTKATSPVEPAARRASHAPSKAASREPATRRATLSATKGTDHGGNPEVSSGADDENEHASGSEHTSIQLAGKQSKAAKQPAKHNSQVQKKPNKEAPSHRVNPAAPAQRRASRAATTTKPTSPVVPAPRRASVAASKAASQRQAPRRASRAAPKDTDHESDREVASGADGTEDNPAPRKKDGGSNASRPEQSGWGTCVYVAVLVAGVVLLGVAFLAVKTIRKRKAADDRMACHTAECREAADYLRNLTVAEHAPCSDFYSRVCGKWSAAGTGFRADLNYALMRKLNASLFETREPPDAEGLRRGMHIVSPLYRTCYG